MQLKQFHLYIICIFRLSALLFVGLDNRLKCKLYKINSIPDFLFVWTRIKSKQAEAERCQKKLRLAKPTLFNKKLLSYIRSSFLCPKKISYIIPYIEAFFHFFRKLRSSSILNKIEVIFHLPNNVGCLPIWVLLYMDDWLCKKEKCL